MANETLTDVFSDIADAVRAKGVTGQMTPLQMPSKIESIPSGGGSKYGVVVDALIGDVDANGALQPPSASSPFSFSSSDIVSIGDNVLKEKFKGTGITQVDLPNLTSIGNGGLKYAFQNCTSLTTVNMPSVTNISGGTQDNASLYGCFDGCTSLTTVKLNKNQTIRSPTQYQFYIIFKGCSSLTNLEFPQITGGVNAYAFTSAFDGCSSITNADFFSGVTMPFGYAFSSTFANCTSLTEVDFSSITTLQGFNCLESVCRGCTSLKKAYFTKLSNTGQGWNHGLEGCTSLELVDFHLATAVPAIGSNTFDNTNNTFQIVVPDDLYDTWITATNWSTRASQIVKYSEYTPAS